LIKICFNLYKQFNLSVIIWQFCSQIKNWAPCGQN